MSSSILGWRVTPTLKMPHEMFNGADSALLQRHKTRKSSESRWVGDLSNTAIDNADVESNSSSKGYREKLLGAHAHEIVLKDIYFARMAFWKSSGVWLWKWTGRRESPAIFICCGTMN